MRTSADILVQYYLDKNYYNRGLSLLQKLTSPQMKKLSLRDDELLWKSLYPRAYHLNTNSEALLRKISPNLIWSIMKAETQYKYDAISPVGAIGLMQFMPYTSQKVALLLKDQHETKDLYKPEIAIQYGAAYLKKLSVEFDNQLPLVAAAYNGGPHRVKLWLRNFGDIDFDVFIEHIPFPETRTYVKRVLSFYATYQKIYDEKIDIKKMSFLIEKNPYKIKEPISLKEEWDVSIK
jgi:soluble lytic murein transglycosylase